MMSFYSLSFIIFLSLSLMAFYAANVIIPKKQWYILLLVNLAFYAFNDTKGLFFIAITSVTTWYGAKYSQQLKQHAANFNSFNPYANPSNELTLKSDNDPLIGGKTKKHNKEKIRFKRRILLFLVLFLNFGILAYLKYWPAVWNSIVDYAHLKRSLHWDALILPMGLSFYTFQAMGYMIDIHNDKYAAEKHYGKFLLFVSFFPQLIQGPINRFDKLASQLYQCHAFSMVKFQKGAQLILFGLLKKYAIADLLNPAVTAILDKSHAELPGSVIIFGVFLFTIQQYADFSGGIDIVLGIAEMFGVSMTPNFRQPYFATSLSDFWRRWHISLGTWMRDYVFYPFVLSAPMLSFGKKIKCLLGNHAGRVLPVAAGNILVFLLVGIWHGPQLHFVLWGLYNGIIIALSDLLSPFMKKLRISCNINENSKCYHIFLILITFFLVNIGGYFDRIPNIQKAFLYLERTAFSFQPALFTQYYEKIVYPVLQKTTFGIIIMAFIIVFINSVFQECHIDTFSKLKNIHPILRWSVYYVIIFLILSSFMFLNTTEGGFMYANF